MPKVKAKSPKTKEEHVATGRNDSCKWCSLCKTSKADDKELVCLWGVGNKNADIVLVGEAPGKDEILQESPFTGESGKLLTKHLKEAGIDRKDIYITNAVKCRPPGNRTPKPLEIRSCEPYLTYELKTIKPKVIGLLGAVALKTVLGIEGITKLRGKPMWSKKYNCWCVPIFHPAYIIRNGESIDVVSQFARDLKYIKRIGTTGNTGQLGTKVNIVDTEEKFYAFTKLAFENKIAAVDTETVGSQISGKILTVQFSWKAGEAWVLPIIKTPDITPFWSEQLEDRIWRFLKLYLEDPQIKKIGQNIKYDYKFFRRRGIQLRGVIFDTMLGHYLLDEEDKGGHGLDSLSLKFTDMGNYSNELHQALGLKSSKEVGQYTYASASMKDLCTYGGRDTDCTFRVFCALYKKVKNEGLLPLLTKVMIPLSFVLAETEMQGVNIDSEYYKDLANKYEDKINKLDKELNNFPEVKFLERRQNKPVNFRSSDQLRVLFFGILKLPINKMTSTKKRKTKGDAKPSTDKEVLEKLSELHDIPKLILEHRKLSKFLSTYIAPMPDLVAEDGKVHTSYQQDRTTTGRLSSSNPNLQNIPKREPEKAKQIRHGFVASEGFTFLEADYGQLEFRLLASESGDETMISDISNKDMDIHKKIASIAFNVHYDEVTKDLRDKAKTIVYATLYGKSEENLAKETDLGLEQVKLVFNALFTRYPKAKRWIDNIQKKAQTVGFITNWIGRRRRLAKGFRTGIEVLMAEAKRQAVNSPIQGGGHDILSVATIRIFKKLKELGLKSRLVMTIHDSLVLEVKNEEFEQVKKIVKEEMERPIPRIRVPMQADMEYGLRLSEMKKIEV